MYSMKIKSSMTTFLSHFDIVEIKSKTKILNPQKLVLKMEKHCSRNFQVWFSGMYTVMIPIYLMVKSLLFCVIYLHHVHLRLQQSILQHVWFWSWSRRSVILRLDGTFGGGAHRQTKLWTISRYFFPQSCQHTQSIWLYEQFTHDGSQSHRAIAVLIFEAIFSLM